jgi:ABC-type multidrug transport system fused ATPase/permease subunit
MGLQDPSSGNVIINSSNLSSFSNLSNFYSYVPQLPFLIDGTIYENVIYGKRNLSEHIREDISLILEKACCKEFVEKFDNGIDTEVGENGVKLSLGQRQRINLARALYRNSKLLIMDEPTSALDPEIEKKIISNLCDSYNKLSFIMVTHKHDILENFDSVYKLENKNLKKIK